MYSDKSNSFGNRELRWLRLQNDIKNF
jgi:hypothetical protein